MGNRRASSGGRAGLAFQPIDEVDHSVKAALHRSCAQSASTAQGSNHASAAVDRRDPARRRAPRQRPQIALGSPRSIRCPFRPPIRIQIGLNRHSPDSGTDQGHGLAFGPQAQQMSPRTAALASEIRGLSGSRRWNSCLCFDQGVPMPSWSVAHPTPRAPHAGAGGARRRAISDRISWNIWRDTATSAIWKVT